VASVTEREVEGTRFTVHLNQVGKVLETGVYGEARFGQAVYASEQSAETLEQILRIISNNAFPSSRSKLSEGQMHQFRDALILEAHIRDGRDIFVTGDAKAFIGHGRREELRKALGVRILTRPEFVAACAQNQLAAV